MAANSQKLTNSGMIWDKLNALIIGKISLCLYILEVDAVRRGFK